METYTIITANIGAVEAWLAHPLRGPNWTTSADVDEEGKVGDAHVMVCPEIGPNLGKLPITPNLRSEVQRLIQKHRDRPGATASPQFGSDLVQYSGTTGNQRVAGLLKAYQTNQWILSVGYLKGLPEDHVQLVDGETVIANVPTEPLATLHARVGNELGHYHSRKHSTSDKPQALICVREMPTGSWLISLWLGGVELEGNADDCFGASRNPAGYRDMLERIERWRSAHGARVESDVDLEEIRRRVTEQPAESGQAVPAGNDAPPADKDPDEDKLRHLRLTDIGHFPGGNQRTVFDQAKLEELAASIRAHGVAEPILVNEVDGRYLLIAGERRLRASHMAGRPTIPARVMHLAEGDAHQLMLIENVHREDLNPMDEARAYQRLLQCDGIKTPADVAEKVGRSRVHVVEYLQLLELPSELQHQIASCVLGVKAGLEFLRRTKEAPDQVKAQVAKTLADEKPSIREAPKVIERELERAGVARATPRPETPKTAPPPAAPAAPPAPPQPAPEPSAPPAPAQEPPAPAVATPPTVEPADTTLRQIGAQYWTVVPGEREITVEIEATVSVADILENWTARLAVTGGYVPRAMGNVVVQIPEHGVWFQGKDTREVKPANQYKPDELCLVDGRFGITVQCANGRVKATSADTALYYRVAIYGGKFIYQQLVIRDGARHIVVNGTDNLSITQDKVQALVEILRKLPAMPAE
jgi:ParB family chromosome partitioning protein